MHEHWQTFLDQHRFEITEADGAARAYARSPATAESATCCVDLNHFTALRLIGADARTFLEGYLTCAMNSLDQSHALLGAYCNIKGRVVADATVLLVDEHPTLLMHASLRHSVVTSLRKYLAFSRSRFVEPDDDAPVLLGIVNPPESLGLPAEPLTTAHFRGGRAIAIAGSRPRVLLVLPAAHARSLWLEFAAQSATGDATAWDLLDIRSGIAHVCAATSETFLPQMLDYDRLGAISFTKGCYLGQEIVARTQHLGRSKRHLHTLRWRGERAPSIGAALCNEANARSGTLVAIVTIGAHQGEALAVLNDDSSGPLQAGGATFEAQ